MDRLGCALRVDAARAEEEERSYAVRAAASSTLTCIRRLSEMKSAGWVQLARMPPTFAAAITTIDGRSPAKNPRRALVSRRSSSAEVRVRPVGEPLTLEMAPHGASHESAMAGDERPPCRSSGSWVDMQFLAFPTALG